MLKRLRGTPIVRHDAEHEMIYSPTAPYEILRTKAIDFETMQRLRRFARFWDLVANSGNLRETVQRILSAHDRSAFHNFLNLSDWLFARLNRTHAIALDRLGELLLEYQTQVLSLSREESAEALAEDFSRSGRRDPPEFLRGFTVHRPRRARSAVPARQARHL
jgi:hypothetical protein